MEKGKRPQAGKELNRKQQCQRRLKEYVTHLPSNVRRGMFERRYMDQESWISVVEGLIQVNLERGTLIIYNENKLLINSIK